MMHIYQARLLLHYILQDLKPAGQNMKCILKIPSSPADPVVEDPISSMGEGLHSPSLKGKGFITEDEIVH